MSNTDDVTSMITQHTEYMQKYTELTASFEALGNEEMSTAEAKLYVETQAKVNQILLDTAA